MLCEMRTTPGNGALLMTRRGWTVSAVMFLVGLFAGGGGVQTYHTLSVKTAREMFAEKLRCKELAAGYIREQSTDSMSLILQRVDYSATSNSCVAYFHTWEDVGNRNTYNERRWQVVDLLTAKMLYDDHCREETNCGGGNDIRMDDEAEAAFDEAVNGRKSIAKK
ncbi:MAG TPA: hypothetical protein VKV05_04745 [Terriglobales bacterium]|nr:hypothetical protein [Terriglobales bacterium]